MEEEDGGGGDGEAVIEEVTKSVEVFFRLAELLGAEHMAIAKIVAASAPKLVKEAREALHKSALEQFKTVQRTLNAAGKWDEREGRTAKGVAEDGHPGGA